MNRINNILLHFNQYNNMSDINSYEFKNTECLISNNIVVNNITPTAKLDTKFNVRKLELLDFNKGFLSLLSQLTVVGDISEEQFKGNYNFGFIYLIK